MLQSHMVFVAKSHVYVEMSHGICCKVAWYILQYHMMYGHFSVVISTQTTKLMSYTVVGIRAYIHNLHYLVCFHLPLKVLISIS